MGFCEVNDETLLLKGAVPDFFSFFRSSPPYYSFFLYSLDFVAIAIPMVGQVSYAYKIAPPDLIATTVAVAGVFLWTVGKGAGSFIGGQSTEVLEITEVFFCTAIFGAISSSCIMAIKTTSGRKWERKVLEEKEILMQQNSGKMDPDKAEVQNDTGKENEMTRLLR